MNKLEEVVEARRRQLDAAMETAGELQVQVDQLTKEIKDKSTGKIRAMDKQIKECIKTIEMSKSEVTKLRVAVKTAERFVSVTIGLFVERILKMSMSREQFNQ